MSLRTSSGFVQTPLWITAVALHVGFHDAPRGVVLDVIHQPIFPAAIPAPIRIGDRNHVPVIIPDAPNHLAPPDVAPSLGCSPPGPECRPRRRAPSSMRSLAGTHASDS